MNSLSSIHRSFTVSAQTDVNQPPANPTTSNLQIHYIGKVGDISNNIIVKNYAPGKDSYDLSFNRTGFSSNDIPPNFGSTNYYSFDLNNTSPTRTFATSTAARNYSLASDGKLTFCFWFKHTSNTMVNIFYPFAIGKEPTQNNATLWHGNTIAPEFIAFSPQGTLNYFYLYAGGSIFNYNITNPLNVFNVWNHFSIVLESGSTPLLYINGTLRTLSPSNNTNTFPLSNFIAERVYLSPIYNDNRYPCRLFDLRVYNSALSQTEITNIYNWNGNTS